jgi:hypothetical protein
MKRIRPMTLLSIALVAMLGLQGILPLATVSAQEEPKQNRIAQKEDDVTNVLLQRIPRLDPIRQLEIESFSQVVADNLVFKKDGKVSVDAKKAINLNPKERQQLNRAVKDINSGHIGLAITGEDGLTRVYGNTKVLSELIPNNQTDSVGISGKGQTQSNEPRPLISSWWDGYGLAIYLDPVFTSRLKSFDSAAIGTLVGLMVTFVCGTGLGCIAASVMVAWFWDQVWQWLDRRYYATSLIIHAPRWGWVYIQPFKSGAWWNGQWFRTWLWT